MATEYQTSNAEHQQPSLYVGALIEHESERAVLQRIVELLSRSRRPAVILANANVGNRQIDLVVALHEMVLVIEAKGYRRPIRGSENGHWQVQLASGEWKDFPSPYLQAREAALSVRDAMRTFARREIPYPRSAVVFVPSIPQGSMVHPGDFKVSIIGLQGLESVLRKRQQETWALDRWKAFAKHLRLTPADSVDAACDAGVFGAHELLRQYQAAFRRENSGTEPFVPFVCGDGEQSIATAEVIRMVSRDGASIMIRGPSGCGKTLLAKQAGVAFSELGAVVFAIPGRDYAGNVRAVMDREIGLLIRSKAANVLSAARASNRPLLFVVDGYNECTYSERESLTRGLAALARDYEGNVLVTSQIALAGERRLPLRQIDVPPAGKETKSEIARNVLGCDAVPGRLVDLLEAVKTGLEAKLIGEVGREVDSGSSRHALFDTFARKTLGDVESQGIRLFSEIAAGLCNRLAFSMSRRDLDRITDQLGIPEAVAVRVRQAGLLTQRADRIHFAHEIWFDAFSAEAVIRTASGEPTPVVEALAHPQHTSRRDFILGAIDDDQLLYQVLERLEDSVSVASCLSGACGRRAQEWAESRIQKVWVRLRSEAVAIRFCVSNQEQNGVWVDQTTLVSWTAVERAFIDVVPYQLRDGRYLDDVLDIIGVLDIRIAEEASRLREEARESRVPSRSAIFASAYVRPASPGIGRICARLHGYFFRTVCEMAMQVLIQRSSSDDLTAGQLYLLLNLMRGSDIPVLTIAHVIKSHWSYAPYHLRLDLMDAARTSHQLNDQDREVLIETIEGLPQTQNLFLSTAIVETLAHLGAFEQSERDHIDVVRSEIVECLSGRPEAENCKSAYRVYASQIDHPYSGAYCEALAELQDDERRTLLMRASSGAEDTSFCVSLILIDLARLGGSEVGDGFSRWTKLPPTDSFMPQDSIAVFAIAHISLARLGLCLSARELVDNNPARAMVACGEVLYWCNRHDLSESLQRHGYEPHLHRLEEELSDSSLHVIRQFEQVSYHMERMPGGSPVVRSIPRRFPDEVLRICRRFLSAPENQVGYFQHYSEYDRMKDRQFAIEFLGWHGNSTDLRSLRLYANDRVVGTTAVAAIKRMEERLEASRSDVPLSSLAL